MRVLIVASDSADVEGARRALEQRGHAVVIETDPGAKLAKDTFHVVVVDTSLEYAALCADTPPTVEVITFGDLPGDDTLQAIAHLSRPLVAMNLVVLIDDIRGVVGEPGALEPDKLVTRDTLFTGDSPVIQALAHYIRIAADSTAPVCVFGEDGSGRWIVARAIHDDGPRRDRSFMMVNAAAHADDELEHLLFAPERGAVATAAGGTVFIDRLPMAGSNTQRRLLQLLQHADQSPIRFIAGMRPGVAVGASPHSVLPDLYYRMKVLELEIPRLRERTHDLEAIIACMLGRLASSPPPIADETLRLLRGYSFPGNILELSHALVHASLVAQGQPIRPHHLPASIQRYTDDAARTVAELATLDEVVRRFERDYLLQVLRAVGGNRGRAATILGLSRKGLWGKLKAHGITNDEIQCGSDPEAVDHAQPS
ncbi:MAG: sigma-54-dependent Fis family transcriptional regulator [Deltaproteobacteria bacterium]|nr:sigma-54-dependent Fis family transcriptional regulator [Deltaproteobacteria bacterium]MDQ3298203.1 sigma 54-interacting transcriptional regulator [Myxococcota bacterium]